MPDLRNNCQRWIRYRLNASFISQALLRNIIPIGFKLKLKPPVPNDNPSRANINALWFMCLSNCSRSLMKHAGAFLSTDAADLFSIIQNSIQPDDLQTLLTSQDSPG